MADNFDVKDATESTITKAAADVGSGVLADKVVLVNGADAAEAPVDATNGLKVDVAANGVIGEVQATPTANTVLARLKAISDAIANITSGTEAQVDVVASLPAGTNVVGGVFPVDSGDNRVDPIGPSTIFRSIDIDESEEEVKATAGTLYWLHAVNRTASPLYLKFYNATAASVTVGTTTPVMTFVVPTLGDTNGAGFAFSFGAGGTTFSTAISVACTTGLADNDTGAPGANACVINLGYA